MDDADLTLETWKYFSAQNYGLRNAAALSGTVACDQHCLFCFHDFEGISTEFGHFYIWFQNLARRWNYDSFLWVTDSAAFLSVAEHWNTDPGDISCVVFVPYCFDNLILFYHSVHEHNFLFSLRRNWKDSYWHIVVSSH